MIATAGACPTASWTYPNGEVVTGDCVLGAHEGDHETPSGLRWHFGEYGEMVSFSASGGIARIGWDVALTKEIP